MRLTVALVAAAVAALALRVDGQTCERLRVHRDNMNVFCFAQPHALPDKTIRLCVRILFGGVANLNNRGWQCDRPGVHTPSPCRLATVALPVRHVVDLDWAAAGEKGDRYQFCCFGADPSSNVPTTPPPTPPPRRTPPIPRAPHPQASAASIVPTGLHLLPTAPPPHLIGPPVAPKPPRQHTHAHGYSA